MKRTKLSERALPSYSRGEEIMNMATHIPGILLGLFALVTVLVGGKVGMKSLISLALTVIALIFILLPRISQAVRISAFQVAPFRVV